MPIDDTFLATLAPEFFDGQDGNDTVSYLNSTAAVRVDLFNNTGLGGFAQGDTFLSIENITGSNIGNQRDWLWGDGNANILQGLAGDDILEGGGGADVIDGGAGWDQARYTRSAGGIYIDLATGINNGGDATDDVLINIEGVAGSNHNDFLIGNTGNNFLSAGAGNDYLSGGNGGWDRLLGGQGNDEYIFNAGFATMVEEGNGFELVVFDEFFLQSDVTITGNLMQFAGSSSTVTFNNINLFELFYFYNPSVGDYEGLTLLELQNVVTPQYFVATAAVENFLGGDGSDTVDFSGSTAAVSVDLLDSFATGGFAQADNFFSIENIIGSEVTTGRDTLVGDEKANSLEGRGGNDFLEGGLGADIINGGLGWDYARYNNSDVGVNINLTTGVHTGGHAAGDTLIGIEGITGSAHVDTLKGGATNDAFWGGGSNDVLFGGLGQDQLYGEAGADTFIFEQATAYGRPDLLRDFKISDGDKIDIADLLAMYDPTTDAITDFVQITESGTQSFLAVDASGGADGFLRIATISAIGLTDEAALEASGVLITSFV